MNENILVMSPPVSDEEKEQIKAKYIQNMKVANSLTKEQLNFLMDGGWYNEAMRGYLIAAARAAEFAPDEIKRLLDGFRYALDMNSKADAEKISNEF